MNRNINRTLLFFVCCASAAASIDGVVTNRTTGKPQSGVAISVNKMNASSGMLNDNAGNATTNAQGQFSFDTAVTGPTMLRLSFEGVNYTKVIPPGTPSSGIGIDVYSASKDQGAAKVEKHMLLFEPANGQMTVNETYLVKNDGQTAWNDPTNGTLHFYLPTAHTKFQIHATAPGGVDVPATASKAGKPDVFKVDFPVKPGETRFDITYDVPYVMNSEYEGKIITKDENTYLIAPNGVNLTASGLTDLGVEPRTQAHIFGLPATSYNIQLSGAEVATAPPDQPAQPDAQSGPQIESMMPRVLDNRVEILIFAGGILGLGFILLYRKDAHGRGRG